MKVRFEISNLEIEYRQNFVKIRKLILFGTKCPNSVSLRIQSKCVKMQTRTTPNKDTLYAVQGDFYRIEQAQILNKLIHQFHPHLRSSHRRSSVKNGALKNFASMKELLFYPSVKNSTLQNRCYQKFRKCHTKTPALESLFNKATIILKLQKPYGVQQILSVLELVLCTFSQVQSHLITFMSMCQVTAPIFILLNPLIRNIVKWSDTL